MVLAIYKRNRPKDTWNLSNFALNLTEAEKYRKLLKDAALKVGLDQVECVIQEVSNAHDAPQSLDVVAPEKLLYN